MTLYETFRNPPSEFRQAPFWFWNHRLDKDALEWQIEQMKDKGLGGFVMHARHGLLTPYLSDEWFDCIRFCCEKAREHGLVAWAYDERDWPSGPAGGEVIADHANRLSYLRFEVTEVEAPANVELDEAVVCAYRAPVSGVAPDAPTPFSRVEGAAVDLAEGRWRVAKAVRFECPAILWFESYLDTLDPEACRAFIRATYDRHEEKLGDLRELGLAGFFTDEPAFSTYPDDLARIPWTAGLPEAFMERKGYDLLDHLPELFSADDPDGPEVGAQVRYDYWDVATTLFENAFFKALEAWCEARGLELIGHPLGEEPLFFQFRCLGNIFYLLKHLHMPGMDHLGRHVGKGGPAAMTPKMIESAALLAGRDRTMTETFGESGWGLSLRDMKWMSDWQIAHGINYFIPHAFYYSVAGRRKKDSPPSEFFQAPFWPYYRLFADYTARLTAAMAGGTHGAKVAVLYPMSSIWTDFVPGDEPGGAVQELEAAFAPLGEALLAIHRDFVVLDEASFANAEVNEKSFTVNGLEFEALVVPKLRSIHDSALAALRRVAGSCVVAAVPNTAVRVIRAAGLGALEHVDLAKIPGVRVTAGADGRGLAQALAEVTPEVTIEDAPDVYYLYRRKEGKSLFFFANTADGAVETAVTLETTGLAEIWDPDTGDKRPAPGQEIVEGRLRLPIALPPAGSCLVVVDPQQPCAGLPAAPRAVTRRIPLCQDLWYYAPENGNFLTLKTWTMRTETRHHVTELHYTTQFMMPENLGNLRLILDGVPRHPYDLPEATRAMMAHETCAVVLLDGEPLTDDLPWEIDPQFRVLDLRGHCGPGSHEIEIVIKNNGWFPQPGLAEYAWLAGDFQIDATGDVPCLVPIRGLKTGPWEEQGHPYFSGTGCFYTDIELEGDVVGKRVFVEAGRVGHILEVEVNTMTAGVRAWPPYRIEVGHLIRAGYNQFVLKVTNTARNFFEGPDKDDPSGLLDEVWLEVEDA